jgi:TonB family protein
MTTFDVVLHALLSNAGLAFVLAVVVALVTRRVRWPAAVHVLWLMVLLRMVAPPLVGLPIVIGSSMLDPTGLVTLQGGAVKLADGASGLHLSFGVIAGLIWLIGAVAVAVVAVVRSRALRRSLDATAPAFPALRRRVEDMAEHLGVKPPKTLLVAGRVPPMLWSRLSGTVMLLPNELLERLDDAGVDALIAHELAHLRRRDHWLRWLELVVTVACWFNPVTWWARRRLRQAEERCCDALVSRTLPNHARAHADTLVETLRFLAGIRTPRPIGAVGMADLSEVQRRLEMILSRTVLARPSVVSRLVLLAVLIACLSLTPVLAAGGADRDLPEVFDHPMTLQLQEADVHDVLRTMGEVTGFEMKIGPGVDGSVTIHVADVPGKAILDLVTRIVGADWRVEGQSIVVFSVTPPPASPMLVGHLGDDPLYKVDDAITTPLKISGPNPIYPEACRTERVMGRVTTDAVIDATGRVVDVTVVDSPDNRLSEAAMDAVQDWVFEPATLDGEPVAVRYQLTINLALK